MTTTAVVISVVDPSGRKLVLPAWAMVIIANVVDYASRYTEGGRTARLLAFILERANRIEEGGFPGRVEMNYGAKGDTTFGFYEWDKAK